MSGSAQLEELQKRKAQLANELRSFDEKTKAMVTSMQILEEKMEVKELEAKVKAKRQAMELLETRKKDLENRLGELRS